MTSAVLLHISRTHVGTPSVENAASTGSPGTYVILSLLRSNFVLNPNAQKRAPTCAICRTKLIRAAPLIPNIAMDNTIAKHVGALAASGCVDWQPTGAKHKEWVQRRECVLDRLSVWGS